MIDGPGCSQPGRRNGIEALARRIENMILGSEMAPGQRLNELALSRQLGVSRASLREAVRGLEQAGLLEIIPNRGVLVRQVSMKGALDLYELRAALFRAAAQLAARRAQTGSVLRLRQLNDEMRAAGEAQDFEIYYARNLQFHALLMEAGNNAAIATTYEQAVKGLHLFRRRSLVRPAQLNLSLQEHEALLEAITAHDAAAAGEAAERHIMLGRDRMLDTLDRAIPA